MATLAAIEQVTTEYAERRELLSLLVANLNSDLEEIKSKHMPEIRAAISAAAQTRERLAALIDESREVFQRPRTYIISGIRVGLKKGTGKVDFEDDAMVIRLIRKHLPAEQQELLIKQTEKVVKKSLQDLDVTTLKKIGVTVEETGDVVFIKAADSEIDKLVAAMLKTDTDEGEEDAA